MNFTYSCDSMVGPWGHYANWNKSDRKSKYCVMSFTCGIWKKKKNKVQLPNTETGLVDMPEVGVGE